MAWIMPGCDRSVTGHVRDRGLFADGPLPRTGECRRCDRGESIERTIADAYPDFPHLAVGLLTGVCWLPLAVGGEQRAATDSDAWSVRHGSAADAAGGAR